MEYSPEFIKKAKEVYPDWKELHIHLDTGSPLVGLCLEYGLQTANRIPISEILAERDLKSLQEKAKEMQENQTAKEELCIEWYDLDLDEFSKKINTIIHHVRSQM